MSNLINVAKQALEALEAYKDFVDDAHIIEGQWHWIDGAEKATDSLRQAIQEEALNRKAENARELGLTYEVDSEAEKQEPCYCDANGIGEPGVSCGDCPIRDYKKPPAEKQEPVAWMQSDHEHISLWKDDYYTIPLYTHPPKREWVGLTDEEMHACWDSPLTPLGMKHARMIEAKLKEKNT